MVSLFCTRLPGCPFQSVVRDFVPIYEATFLNFSEESHLTDSDADSILLVIYGDDLLDAATAIKNWKGEATTVDLKSCTEMGGTSDAILTSIENYYNTNPGLTYVVIVGDINAVPSPTGPHSNAVSGIGSGNDSSDSWRAGTRDGWF